MANRYSRVLLEESVKYGRQRRTFGRRLLDHQVLRHKIADMAGRVEAVHALLEQIAYQMKARVPDSRIGGITALAKVQAKQFRIGKTKVFLGVGVLDMGATCAPWGSTALTPLRWGTPLGIYHLVGHGFHARL